MRIQTKTVPILLSIALVAMLSGTVPFGAMAESTPVNVWWPTNGAHVSGTQPFKAQVPGLDVSSYEMFWQVDGGTWNHMDNNTADYPHKESAVALTSWTWHGAGPYVVTFIAQRNGTIISQQEVTLYMDNGLPIQLLTAPVQNTTAEAPAASIFQVQVGQPASAIASPKATVETSVQPVVATVQTAIAPVVALAPAITVSAPQVSIATDNGKFYVNPDSSAASAGSDPAFKLLAAQSSATWFGNWNSDIYGDVKKLVTAAAAANATPVMVAYDIPARDCGGYSSGGNNSVSGYQSWINSFASAIGSNRAVVIVEPDAIAQINCLSQADQATRYSLLSGAVAALKANPNTKVYVDAGHSNWIDANTMAQGLQKAGVNQADGFALNVSNFMPTAQEVTYGQQIAGTLGGKHFVVDTSRNGNGSNGQWCNPTGMAIGTKPTTQTGNSLVDAYLWLKTPGESDGNCNGGPSAGGWWGDYAKSLVANSHQ
jgi:endoglucanase